jgi:hypothetical protein
MVLSLQDIPKKIQYIVVDSEYVNGTNNTFSLDLTLKSNTPVEDSSRVLGIKMVGFYVTEIGEANPNSDSHVSDFAKYIDIICPEIPPVAQMLDERNSQIFARIPLERPYSHGSPSAIRDNLWNPYERKTNYFYPLSIKKMNFTINEYPSNGSYVLLQPDAKWYLVLEITTVDIKEKPINKEAQILEALYALIGKIDMLNNNVKKLPNKEEAAKIVQLSEKKKYSFNYFLLALCTVESGYIYYVNWT